MKELAAEINTFVKKLIKARHNFRLRDSASYEGAEEILNLIPGLCDSMIKSGVYQGVPMTLLDTKNAKYCLTLDVAENYTFEEYRPGTVSVTATISVLERSNGKVNLHDRAYVVLNTVFSSYSDDSYRVKHVSLEAATTKFPFNIDASLKKSHKKMFDATSPKEKIINIAREVGVTNKNALFMDSPTLAVWRLHPDSTIVERGRNYMGGSLALQVHDKLQHVSDSNERSMLCLQHGVICEA
tara:strand:- start:9781 stop:10503 length:723 start_codon:yes stop_codon:yes gene_type:complete